MGNTNDKSKIKVKANPDNRKVDLQDFVSSPGSLIRSEAGIIKNLGDQWRELAETESNYVVSPNDPDCIDVSFSVDAGIIDRLGRELVSKKETAVSELIKNAYDADAVNVRLIFIDADTETGELRIEDDGSGMNLDDLVNGFMRISSSDKAVHPHSPVYRRQRAGQKGIGRFATQRLGLILEIITQTAESSHAYKVIINWDDYKTGLDLTKIHNRLEQIPRRDSQGTLLSIKILREFWSPQQILSIYNDVSDLILPSFIFEEDSIVGNSPREQAENGLALKKSKGEGEPGFNLSVYRRTENADQIVADVQTQLFDKTLGVISGYVDENGNGFWSLESKKLHIEEINVPIGSVREETTSFRFLKNVSLKTHYFHSNSGVIPRTDETALKRFFREKGGVRLYRNGFKVRPYGEVGDDWLKLDYSTRRRKYLYPHANDNFYGYVEVTDLKGAVFEETSSREGLLENEAFLELQDFAQSVLVTAASRFAAVRGKKITSSQKDWNATSKLPELVKEMRSRLSEAISYAKASARNEKGEIPEPFLRLLETAETVDKDLKRLRGTQEKLLEEQGMLRVLASLGLIIGEFTHEIKHTLSASSLLSKQLIARFKPGTKDFEIADDLKFNIERFKTYAAYFGRAIADNANRELAPRDLEAVVDDFIETVSYAARNSGITVKKKSASDGNLFTCPMHASELASILFNLYSNAQKAIIRARVKGEILISLSWVKNVLLLDFCDNGDGIPSENKELIFEAFFTTTRAADVTEPDEELLQGAGLGLKIVKDILQSYQGDIYLEDAPEGYSTCFRCEIPKAQESAL